MKATHKNLTNSDYTTKSGLASLNRIRGFLRLNTTLGYQTERLNSSIMEFIQTKENEVLKIETEIRRNQGRTYASIVPPK